MAAGTLQWVTFQRGKGGLEQTTAGTLDLAPPDGVAATAGAAPPLSAAETVARLKPELVLGVPFQHVLIRVVQLPTDDADEVRGMVNLQVDKLSPFASEQTVAAHEILRIEASGTTVLIAIARRTVLDEMRVTLGTPTTARVDALPLGLWAGLLQSGQLAAQGRELLLVADAAGVQIIAHEDGTPLAFTYIAGPFDLSRAEDRSDIAWEAARLAMSLEAEHGQPTALAAAVWADPAVTTDLAGAVGETCAAPCRGFASALLPTALEGVVRRGGQGAAVIDLTPAAWRGVEQAARFRRRIWGTVATVLVTWGLLVGAGFGLLAYERYRIRLLDSEHASWVEPANDVRTMRRRVAMIRRYQDRHDSALECLREVSVLQPQGVDLDSFTYRKDESVDITGIADTSQIVLQFNAGLNGSRIFKQVTSGPQSLTKDGRYRFSFDLKFAAGGSTP